MAGEHVSTHLTWHKVAVEGRTAVYGEAPGAGPTVLFCHGWALGHHSYKVALGRLAGRGFHVLAPALPGFGGTADLPNRRFNFAGYAAWVDSFLAAVGHPGPVFAIGHSFGGGVAIKLAHDFPDRVSKLVLVNSVGTPMAGRTLLSWGIGFPEEGLSLPGLTKVVPRVLEDALPNVARNPVALLRVANLVRRADLAAELEELKRRRLPVVVLWGEQDRIIPRKAFEAMCASLDSAGEVVGGNHSWLLSDPDAFGEVITNVLKVKELADEGALTEAAGDGDRQPGRRPAAG